jgi:predicted RNA-binding Zn ribbon-like protein
MSSSAVNIRVYAVAMTHPFAFELDAGRLCLDFANTRDSSGEHVASYADLLAFARQSHLITPRNADWLQAAAGADPSNAQSVLDRALQLRAAIYAIFSALAANHVPPDAGLQELNAELGLTLGHARVLREDDGYRWGWAGQALDAPLWPVTRSAADVLTSDLDRPRIRECGGSECQWLFLDTSKNRSRQWCSMAACGNRAKARRHYQRRRTASTIASQPNSGSAS